jgi:hypothetical protein
MELLPHDLKAILNKQKQPFTQPEVKTLMTHLLSAIEHLHDNWVLLGLGRIVASHHRSPTSNQIR